MANALKQDEAGLTLDELFAVAKKLGEKNAEKRYRQRIAAAQAEMQEWRTKYFAAHGELLVLRGYASDLYEQRKMAYDPRMRFYLDCISNF